MAVRRREHLGIASMVLTATLAAGCTTSGLPSDEGSSSSHSSHSSHGKAAKGDESTARKELAKLKIAAAGSMSSYDPGPVRHAVEGRRPQRLRHPQRHPRARPGQRAQAQRCVVIAGDLHDPYSGKDIDFVKARASEVQIDHIFPLGLAWRMGASQWSADRRAELANDRDNLLAVWGRPNAQKRDKGPAEWQPEKTYQCTYAEKFIAVADEYELSVTDADHSELKDMLDAC